SAAGVVRDERIERDQVGAVLVLGLVEGALDVVTREDGGEVEEGAGDGGDWDTGARGDLVGRERGAARAYPGASHAVRRRDLARHAASLASQTPRRTRRLCLERHGRRADRHHGLGERQLAVDGVDLDGVALAELALEELERELVDQALLDDALERPRAVRRVVAQLGE